MQDELIVGGLYSVESGDGRFSVVKVLALQPGIVHARLYNNKFGSRPVSIDPAVLSLGSILEGNAGIGHTPLSLQGFLKWQPVLMMTTMVTEGELVGYNFWKNSSPNRSANSLKDILSGVAERLAKRVRRKRPN
jgi:hypothetical protein